MYELQSANAVLIGKSINVSIFQQIWLVENAIIEKTEFGPGSYVTPVAVSVEAPLFQLIVTAERIQLVLKSPLDDAENILQRVIGGIARNLPHTPINAMGLNFDYIVSGKHPDRFESTTRTMFFPKSHPLAKDFNVSDARFGNYLSKNHDRARLRVDSKPVKRRVKDTEQEHLRMQFNLHRDLGSFSEVQDFIPHWNDSMKYVEELVLKMSNAMEA